MASGKAIETLIADRGRAAAHHERQFPVPAHGSQLGFFGRDGDRFGLDRAARMISIGRISLRPSTAFTFSVMTAPV